MKSLMVLATAMLVALIPGRVLAGSLQNGSFETGSLSGWSKSVSGSGQVSVQSSLAGWTAGDGQYFAVLKSDSQGTGKWTTLWQKFYLDAGQRVSFDYFFTNSSANSDIQANVRIELGPLGASLLDLEGIADQTPQGVWQLRTSFPAPAAGQYALKFSVRDPTFDGSFAHLGVDNVRVHSGYLAAPEPMTAVGVFLALVGVAGYLRKRIVR